MSANIPSLEEAEKLDLTSVEFEKIKSLLNRHPNALELELFSRLWSEHASYKNSIKWLKTLPTKGENILVEAGDDNAGVVDLGDGNACVFKVESHNSPCAIQPRLGAFTGLRVVMRDVVSMGAKPAAFLSSLRFGDGKRDTARWLFEEVADGICEFERGFGVPILGGETFFSRGYNTTPIVNNMAIGIVPKDNIIYGKAEGKGSLLLIVGARTGKDGVERDVFETDILAEIDSPPVSIEQMMDASIEKELFEAIQQLNQQVKLIGVQPIGTQGIVGAAVEMAARGNAGAEIAVEKIPQRQAGLNIKDVLLSQTWGRVLICVPAEELVRVKDVVESLEVAMAVIGKVTDGDKVVCSSGEEIVAELPVNIAMLGDESPVYERDFIDIKDKAPGINLDIYDEPDHYPDVVQKMLSNLNVTSKSWLTDKFNNLDGDGGDNGDYPSDAAFINVEGSDKALAATMDCNSRYMKSDAFIGAQIAVAEAARNIVCAGGQPLALSDCLNFGNPHDPKVYGTFVESVKGITKACKDFNVPVVSGNVSFYNQRSEDGHLKPITPTPVIGMIGVMENKKHHSTLSFKHKGDMIFLVGQSRNDVNSSEYASSILNIKKSAAPYYDAEEEKELQAAVMQMIKKGLVRSVHDVSNGGLFFSLLESAIPMEFGFDITSDAEIRKEAFLFGESQSRVVVSVAPEKQDDFVDFMMETDVPFSILGHVTKGEVRIDDESYGYISELKEAFEQKLEIWVEGE
ncbi:phosphoribosylformylglycinamidine synthase subunit PurL [Carboxylicivirga sediminis]|uniref:Phosphoribosylformylglycinamidine synthase subunit PurL n=1 Tax=Carboxylicivirga sediminis TaxID=2006564 RepID=A0A941EYZ4_9BACT|nr:phosphoribosylformylglycinamidine synthase subunit PurL [Carboxylicivirga sediminis]MBR8534176.1 phosphoribosylformylglycinamidine synthase subunit PurL [Carboxylicivirga sediminis]